MGVGLVVGGVLAVAAAGGLAWDLLRRRRPRNSSLLTADERRARQVTDFYRDVRDPTST